MEKEILSKGKLRRYLKELCKRTNTKEAVERNFTIKQQKTFLL